MKIGLIGMPNSGKTTVFNTLTRGNAEITSYAGSKTEPHLAVVEVADDRMGNLWILLTLPAFLKTRPETKAFPEMLWL